MQKIQTKGSKHLRFHTSPPPPPLPLPRPPPPKKKTNKTTTTATTKQQTKKSNSIKPNQTKLVKEHQSKTGLKTDRLGRRQTEPAKGDHHKKTETHGSGPVPRPATLPAVLASSECSRTSLFKQASYRPIDLYSEG